MKNSKILKLVTTNLVLSLTLNSTTSFAQSKSGGINVGGGKGIVCRDPKNLTKITKPVELLDLWEQREIRKRPALKLTGSLKENLNAALERSKHILSEQDFKRHDGSVWKAAEQFMSEILMSAEGLVGMINFLNIDRYRNKKLTPTYDSFESMTPNEPGCELEQIARLYPQRPHWEVNQDLIDHMDQTNLIGFSLHESIYNLLHTRTNESNSLRVRRATGFVMAGGSFRSIESQLTKPYVKCELDQQVQRQAMQQAARQDPLAPLVLYKFLHGTIYFTQDPRVSAPSLTAIVERIGHVTLIDFNHQLQLHTGIHLDKTAPEFYKELQKPGAQFSAYMAGGKDDIEFNTHVQFNMKSGVGRLQLTQATGFETLPAPIENIRCKLIQ